MANPLPPTTATPASRPDDPLARNYQTVCLSILVLAALFAIGAGVSLWLYHFQHKEGALPYLIWSAVLCLVCLVCASMGLMPRDVASGGWTEGERARVLILLVVGVVGFATAVLGLAAPFANKAVFGESLKVWRENLGVVSLCLAVLFGGILCMFVGLNLARSYVVGHPDLRRLIFGYNAVLGSLLLLCILTVVNFLPYIQLAPFKYLSQTYDWTTTKLYSLTDESKNILLNLKEPVNVKVILSGRGSTEVLALLDNCRSVTDKLTWEELASLSNREEVNELARKYGFTQSGLLVLYGGGENKAFEFIPQTELVDNLDTEETRRFVFKGESALMNAISYLSQGKARSKVYFTKGHGERELDGVNPQAADQGLSVLKGELEQKKYDLQSLQLGLDTKEIPVEADVVVIAGPKRPFGEHEVKLLRDYLHGEGGRKKGRLIALIDPLIEKGAMEKTGLEPLFAEYNVKLGNDRLMSIYRRDNPLAVVVGPDEDSTNLIAKAFVEGGRARGFPFDNARTVGPLQANPQGGGARPETVLATFPEYLSWAETNLDASPKALVDELRKDQGKLLGKISRVPLPVAVAVSEGGSTMPSDPVHMNLPREGQPRMIVVGNSGWISNQGMVDRASVSLFSSCLAWLREKPNLGSGNVDKFREQFRLQVPPDGGWRLVLLPVGLLLLCVCVLGSGIWIVRRR